MQTDYFYGLKRRDFRDFNIARTVNNASAGRKQDFAEASILDEFEHKAGIKLPGQTFVPFAVLQRDNLAGTATLGGAVVPSPMTTYTPALSGPSPLLQRLGCQVAYGLQGVPAVPRVSSGATASTTTEGAQFATVTPEYAAVNFSPFIASARVRISRLLWTLGPLVERIIKTDLVAAINREIDRSLLFGSGSDGEPVGLLTQAPVGFATVAAGIAPDLNVCKTLSAAVAAADGLTGQLGFVTSLGVRRLLKATSTADTGEYDWVEDATDGTGLRGLVDNRPAYAASFVPETLDSGTVTGAAAPIICGSWNSYLLGFHGPPGVGLTIDQFSDPAFVHVTGEVFASGSPLQPSCFAGTDNIVLS